MCANEIPQVPLHYAEQRQKAHLEELMAFLRIPSVSTQPERTEDVRAAAEWVAEALRRAGLENVRVIATQRHPLVYADWLQAGPDAPTVLIYGHYDVQPAEPLEAWETPPFEATIRDDYVYGRGTSDDKGQLYIHVKAVEAYLQSVGRLPVNVKFILEGEEESGGESLAAFIPEHEDLLDADFALISDTAMSAVGQPSIIYGLRGSVYVFLDVTGPGRDLHSGSYGGGIDNPINALAHIIAKLKDEKGHILVPGFYDNVRPLDEEERALLAKYPLDEAAWLAETGAPGTWGEPEYSLLERLGARPTLDVTGIIGGYTGPGGKTVLPAHVHAKLSMRLVPNQDPARIVTLFRRYVESVAPATVRVQVKSRRGTPASVVNLKMPAIQAAAKAYADVFGREPVYRRVGGSIPVVGHLQRQLGLETVLMGFGLPGDRIHAPNERFYLPNFYQGIATSIHFLAKVAELEEEEG